MQSEAGTLLIEGSVVDESQLQQALSATVGSGGTLIQNLIRLGFASDDQLASFFARRLQIPLAESTQFANLPAFITRLVPNDVVMTHRTVPIMLHQGVLHIAMSDPTDRAALEEISFITGYSASPVAAPDNLVESAMARYYGIPPDESIPVLESLPEPAAPPIQMPGDSVEASGTFAKGPAVQPDPPAHSPEKEPRETDSQLVVIEPASGELEELFGMGPSQEKVIQLTKQRKVETVSSITDAIRLHVDKETHGDAPEEQPATAREPKMSEEHPAADRLPVPAFDQGPERIVDTLSGLPPLTPPTDNTDPASGREEPAVSPEDGFEPLGDSEEVRYLIGQASDRDKVARTLVRYAYSFMPRVVLFIVKKDILVGWMGAGEGISPQQVKGIMIPLNSPSVFRTVREAGTDYFGSLPRTTVNDIFLAALSDVRPKQILLIPVTVRHKPICILYGDCGTEPGFSKDLSSIHLIAQDASTAFEKIIIDRKMNRLVNR